MRKKFFIKISEREKRKKGGRLELFAVLTLKARKAFSRMKVTSRQRRMFKLLATVLLSFCVIGSGKFDEISQEKSFPPRPSPWDAVEERKRNIDLEFSVPKKSCACALVESFLAFGDGEMRPLK